MTCRRSYSCNLCSDPIDPSAADAYQTGHGIYFVAMKDKWLEFRPVRDCERHICNRCYEAVAKHYNAAARPTTQEQTGREK